ncbi:hypothetical protein ACU9D5_003976 [Cronobacter dublinensis]|uniref:hypothetical protein n=1 Tax=Cronobacter sakazakii TaxID=28141 RepID=UPI001AE29AFF|nr:hypothetical protein [Cronobacter sakazakii]ELY2619867.1 hypothetical protein [Cronobacter malonaticus]ELY2743056.1 hypothetical protein [Cronobacter turicensis]EKK3979866.1 hypothetical protein [Cronobacter sakazakii]EKM6354582.1 hypothetical protein [Cronobacter sakazakii]EKM6370873.1 hypothetical protein [Cronobacter sakazakii]
MKKVMIFFNDEPVTVLSVLPGVTGIHRRYPHGKAICLAIRQVDLPSFKGIDKPVYIATDRELNLREILEAICTFS